MPLPLETAPFSVCPMDKKDSRRWHDMGGLDGAPIDMAEHDYALWEKRVDALLVLSTTKGFFTVDGLRRVIEDLGPAYYEKMSYYERWVHSVNQNLIEAGAYSLGELGAKMAEVAERGETYGDCAGCHDD